MATYSPRYLLTRPEHWRDDPISPALECLGSVLLVPLTRLRFSTKTSLFEDETVCWEKEKKQKKIKKMGFVGMVGPALGIEKFDPLFWSRGNGIDTS